MRADAREGGGLCHRQQPSDQPHMGTAFAPAKTSSASWDAFSDVDAFVDAVLAELAAMAADGTRSTRSGPKPSLTGAVRPDRAARAADGSGWPRPGPKPSCTGEALRKAIMALWRVAFCGMQWRAI